MASLAGKRIVNTRAVHQAAALDALLRSAGAEPIAFPCLAIRMPEDMRHLDEALADLAAGRFAWLVLTSANTVHALAERLRALNWSLPGAAFRTACIGPGTAEAAWQELQLVSIPLPDEFIAESLADSLPIQPGDRVCLPESAIARPVTAARIAGRGAQVFPVTAYRVTPGEGGVDLAALLGDGQVDALTFTSSSTVTYCLARLAAAPYALEVARALPAACIGPKTAATAMEQGFSNVETAAEHSLPGLIAALAALLSVHDKPSGPQA